jgi:GT2 family glycosyltransferase
VNIAAVIASRGDPQLIATLRSIEANCSHVRPLVVDDSDFGLPARVEDMAKVIRGPHRLGCARARHFGSRHLLSNGCHPDVVAFNDDHMAFMPDDERIPTDWRTGPYAPTPGSFKKVAEVALSRKCIAYASCNNQGSATLGVVPNVHSVLRCTWSFHHGVPTATTGMMGAFYFVPVEILERMGGWPALAGWIGWDEEAVSLLAWRMGIEIVYVPGVMTWHDFNSARRAGEYPYDKFLVSLASMWRLLLDDQHWPAMRKHLATDLMLECTSVPMPEQVLLAVETPEHVEYAHSLHEKFIQSDEEFLREWVS